MASNVSNADARGIGRTTPNVGDGSHDCQSLHRADMPDHENGADGPSGANDALNLASLPRTPGSDEARKADGSANESMGELFPDLGPETPVISGVAHDRTESLVTICGVRNEPGMAARVFERFAKAGVNVDMIVQAGASTGTADISFTVPSTSIDAVRSVLEGSRNDLGYREYDIDTEVGKVAVVGVGMKTHSGLAAKFFAALSDKKINVLMISTSEIRIAALVPIAQLDDAVRALHTAYGLDATQVEAVVYGGTGR